MAKKAKVKRSLPTAKPAYDGSPLTGAISTFDPEVAKSIRTKSVPPTAWVGAKTPKEIQEENEMTEDMADDDSNIYDESIGGYGKAMKGESGVQAVARIKEEQKKRKVKVSRK